MKTLKVGMLGCGTVGSQVARLMVANKADLTSRAGAELELVKVAVRDTSVKREGISSNLITEDAQSVVNDPSIDLIIEVMGGISPAKELILTALKNGKSVVTANKALLASHGADLFTAADNKGVDLYYEAAVAGAIPIIRPMRESLVGDQITRVIGIVNGTTNYILTKMDEEGRAFDEVLKEAQSLGYAEADPTADIEGFDAASKAAIIAGLAFHSRVSVDDVHREGISSITADDVAVAKTMNHVIKLLAIAELTPDNRISVRVHPALIARSHPLAAVRDAFNHDLLDAEELGYGRAAAHALGVEESRVFKTLLAQSEKSAVVAIVPVSSQLSLKSLALVLGVKRCEMVPANDAQRITGYVVGGISPFGQKKKLLTVVDESASDFSTIFVSGGRRGLDLEVAPSDLLRLLDAKSGAIATTDA